MTRCGYCGTRFEVRDGSTFTITLEGPSTKIAQGYRGRRFCCPDCAVRNARHEQSNRVARARAMMPAHLRRRGA